MAQSLSKLFVHIIFHAKNERAYIRSEDEEELYSYISGVIMKMDSTSITINGMSDHLHILSAMSKNISLSDFVSKIKSNSSRWIKTKDKHYEFFEWQGGYAGYSVSPSKMSAVTNYIKTQKEHHKKVSSKDEYLQFLKEYNVEFDERYIWT